MSVDKTQEKKSSMSSFSVFSPVTKTWSETITKGEVESEERFFEVTVSGVKEDREGEIMDSEAVNDMLLQFKSGSIPLFADHGRMPGEMMPSYSWKGIMGVWVDANLDGDNLKAVARLNKAHPDSELLWDFIKNGMPVGFSIGGKPAHFVDEEVTA